MFRTTFIAITGSVGKTTATECLKHILSSCFPVNGTRHGGNSGLALGAIVLRTRWRHRFTVIEVGTNLPGALRRAAWMIAPDAVVVLTVAGVHTNNFATLEDIAAEKAQLLSRLGRKGLAILNGDDPRVAAMAARHRGRTVTFGRSPEFDLWASEVSSAWPARLSFRVHLGAESRMVRTRLVGEHWLTSVLGALAAAVWSGVELDRAVEALEQVEPSRGRMDPMPLPSGATMLRDDFGDSFASVPAAMRVLEQAEGRRILAYHDEYDSGLAFRDKFRVVGRMTLHSADLVLLYGNDSRRALNAMIEGGVPPESVLSFPDIWVVAEYIRTSLGPGDVVLLRERRGDAAGRIYFAQLGSVGCRVPSCPLVRLCDYCGKLRPGLEDAGRMPAPARPFWSPID
jgi:UDP-N-acetylmuramoyl-tripeptide--D-alanyl-D-alanine ligase